MLSKTIIFAFLGCLILPAAILEETADKTKGTTSAPISLESISEDLNEAKNLFKLQYEFRHKVTIDQIDIEKEPEVFDGSYFNSGIFRLTFSCIEGDKTVSSSVLLKVPQMGPMFHHGQRMSFHFKERIMYETVIPMMYENVPYEERSPNYYGCTESDILILEDLRLSGYLGYPKGSLVNFPQCEAVWKSLARFHALSTKPLDKVTVLLDSFTIRNRCHNEWITKIFPPLLAKLKKHVMPLCSDTTNTFLDHFLVDFCPTHVNPAFSPNKFGRDVILHGDAHLSNILFKYGPSNEIECKFVDFQISRRGSPVIDLMYFTIISVNYEVFDQHRDSLFDIYIREFNGTLENIGAPKENFYTLDAFKTEWEMYRNYFFFVLIGVAPPLWAGHLKTNGVDSEEDSIDELFKSEMYKSAFKGWTKHLLPAQ